MYTTVCYNILVGGFKYFLFSPLFGEDSHFDYIIFFKWVETTNQYTLGYFWYSCVFWISEFIIIHPELKFAWRSSLSLFGPAFVQSLDPYVQYCLICLIIFVNCPASRRSTGVRRASSTADNDPHCASGPLYGYRHGRWESMKVIGVWDFLSGFRELQVAHLL